MKKVLAIFLIALLSACGGSDNDVGAAGAIQGQEDANGTPNGNINPGSSGTNGATPGTDDGPAPGTDDDADDDAQQAAFLTDAYQHAIGELAFAGLASGTATNDNVRLLADRLRAQQPDLVTHIRALAGAQGVTLPDEPTEEVQAALEALAPLTGDEFDRAYMSGVVTRHEQYVVRYDEAADAEDDSAARVFASNALGLQQLSLEAAKTVAGVIDPNTFLANLYQQGLAEIALSQLALERAESAEVQAYAQRMIDDHTAANQQIAAQAQTIGVTLPESPSPAQQALAQDMAALTGVNFDKAYMNHNVLAHEVAVAQASAQAQGSTPVTALAAELEPVLRMHREMAETLYEQITPTPLFTAYGNGLGKALLAHLALQESDDAQLEAFANRLLDDYSASNQEARQLAQQAGEGLPPEPPAEAAAAFVALSQLSEDEFDDAFVEETSVQLEQVEDLLAAALSDSPEVERFVDNLLSTLRSQIEAALSLRAAALE